MTINQVARDLGISCTEAEELIEAGQVSYDVDTGRYYQS